MVPNPNKGEDDRSPHLSPTIPSKNRLHIEHVGKSNTLLQHTDRFGDNIPLKKKNILRVGFQNIGGFPSKCMDPKEDFIRLGLTNWNFDLFGLAETNRDWHLLPEGDKLWSRTCEWWEHLHINFSHNTTFPATLERQYGGTALFTINETAHRVIEKGKDNLNLGRWVRNKLHSKNEQTITIISAYRPNPPSAGVLGAYAQHTKYFNTINRETCPREAFLVDLCQDIIKTTKRRQSHNINVGRERRHVTRCTSK
jgi:hypothetical protein